MTSKIDFERMILALFDELQKNPLSMFILGQKSCIFEMPQPN